MEAKDNRHAPSEFSASVSAQLLQGNSRLLALSAEKLELLKGIVTGVIYMTPKNVLFLQIPSPGHGTRRTNVNDEFRAKNDIPKEYTRQALTNHYNIFTSLGFARQDLITEEVMPGFKRPVFHIERTAVGEAYVLPAAYVAENFEDQQKMSAIEVLHATAKLNANENAPFTITRLLLHLATAPVGLHTPLLARLTGTKTEIMANQLEELEVLGILKRNTSGAYVKAEGATFEASVPIVSGKLTKQFIIAEALNSLPANEFFSATTVWNALSESDQKEISLYTITERLKSFIGDGLAKIDTNGYSLYELTALGRIVVSGLLLPILEILEEKQTILIPNKDGVEENLYETIIPRLQVDDEVSRNTLRQFREHARTPQASKDRHYREIAQALGVFSEPNQKLTASQIQEEANLPPNVWKHVRTRMLTKENDFVQVVGSAGRRTGNLYILTPRGAAFLAQYAASKEKGEE